MPRLSATLFDDRGTVFQHKVILCNFGGPTHKDEVEPFLFRLFSDPQILRMPRILRNSLARRLAAKRAPNSAHEYEKIGFSPINGHTLFQAELLGSLLSATKGEPVEVSVVNRYTQPFANDVLKKMSLPAGKIFLLALYPHFSTTSTGSSFREIEECAASLGLGHASRFRFIAQWWQHASYLAYSAELLQEALRDVAQMWPGERVTVLCSAHGIPQSFVFAGDPYRRQVMEHSAELEKRIRAYSVAEDLAMPAWQLAYQSRVGPVKWLQPYTDYEIPRLAKENGGILLLYPISFVSDHLETLFEGDVTYRNLALEAGFKGYQRVRMPNKDPKLAACLQQILLDAGF